MSARSPQRDLPIIDDHGYPLVSIASPITDHLDGETVRELAKAGRDGLPHYPGQADRDAAAAGAGLIVILVLAFVFTLGVLVGFGLRGLLG